MKKPIYDHNLIFQAQTKATGANIHDVKSLLNIYEITFHFCNKLGWKKKDIECIKRTEIRLRQRL